MNPSITILFYPEMPEPSSVAYKLCSHLGYRISNNPTQPFDVAFKYFDATFFSADLMEILDDIKTEVINIKSLDISKQKISEVFEAVFGYPILINPLSEAGLAFKKSNINSLSDGEVIELPITEENFDEYSIYQKFIDTQTEGQYVDIHMPIYDGLMPLAIIDSRPQKQPSPTNYSSIEIQNVSSVFSEIEVEQLKLFAQKLSLDYGEFDILRDRHDGKIYVVDVNNTPCEFPQGLTADQQEFLLEKLSDTFVPLIAKRL
ncbi:hypothetical protein Lepto7376_0717 [[Leptolyngbya] sp. PCC 7376]|uniref:hypothetical protein n=1 Tax=[Leptolyngbya] sp. PCC 7376 TaxID=111781 RepID=UPI00029EDE9C|nr:hypothetical protein [[Leptolyngbya] sp. PCC 7376]AFY37115.1 hypothetical protein Lepto7376_0717 [[Leptolyngbya] sp. PCC 7376]